MIADVIFFISFLLTLIGVGIGIYAARLAYGGALNHLTIFLLIGIVAFAIHHVIEIYVPGKPAHDITEFIESTVGVFFLIGAALLYGTLRRLRA